MNKEIIKRGICKVVSPYSYCKNSSEQNLVGYFLKGDKNEKVSACEICYQGTKQEQWEINWQHRIINVKWFYFYDKNRQKIEDKLQLDNYNHRKNCSCFETKELVFNNELKKWIETEKKYICLNCKEILEKNTN